MRESANRLVTLVSLFHGKYILENRKGEKRELTNRLKISCEVKTWMKRIFTYHNPTTLALSVLLNVRVLPVTSMVNSP